MDVNEDKKNEKIGRAIVNVSWFIFAAKFIIVATLVAGIVIYIMGRPLWLAPVIAAVLFIIYRLIWRLVWVFIGWASRQ